MLRTFKLLLVTPKRGNMSVFNLFRHFFDPPGMRDPFFGGMTLGDEDDDEDEDDFFPGHRFQSPFRGERPPFHVPFHDPFQDVFRDFNQLFPDFPRIPGAEPPAMTPEGSRGGSLRDSMLKIPDSHLPRGPPTPDPPTGGGAPRDGRGWPGNDVVQSEDPKQDKVLDSEVSSRGLDSILRPQRSLAFSSFFRSVCISKVTRADGTVKEKRTVRDGQGNTTTTVTVTKGGEVISSETLDTPRNSVIDPPDSSALLPPPSLPDSSDSQTVLSRILHRWFSGQ